MNQRVTMNAMEISFPNPLFSVDFLFFEVPPVRSCGFIVVTFA